MGADFHIANLLRIACIDLDGAKVLEGVGNRNAIYLCSQAAEKLILAVLSSENEHGGVRHQFDAMVALVPDVNPLKASLRELEGLSAYATSYRYATSAGKIPKGPSGDQLKTFNFGVDLGKEGAPARTTTPIR